MTKCSRFLVRLLCLSLCLGCLLGLAQPVGAVPEISKAYPQYIYTAPVYCCASDDSSIIGHLENGARVEVLEESGEYYRVDCYDMTGYIEIDQVKWENEECYVNCDTEDPDCGVVSFQSAEALQALRDSLLELTMEQLGDPYVYGGSSPGGFDCSGLVYYVYGQQDYALERGASDQMAAGLIVDPRKLEVGDLVFFRDAWSSYLATHVGIYVGDGQMIHAGSGGISYAPLNGDWYAAHFVGARRVVTVDPAEAVMSYETALLKQSRQRIEKPSGAAAPKVPLCKGSCHATSVTEGLTR